ncbi:MAG: hypothetical protein RBT75_02980 [Anaerolineae bacterium]|jgi:hypothetical protein|nr:hypothetical protein [Anaerolineae bacterium]
MKTFILRLMLVGLPVMVALTTLGQAVLADAIPPIGLDIPENSLTYPLPKLLPPPPPSARQLNGNGIQEAEIISNPVLDMKVLVINDSIHSPKAVLDNIQAYLDILGIPYDTFDAAGDPLLGDAALWDGVNHGYYYGIIVSAGIVTNPWYGSMTLEERTVLEAYERNFRVRRLTWYADNPYELDYGLVSPATASTATLSTALTSDGQALFDYLQPDITLSIADAYALLTTPATDADVTTLLTDDARHALLSIFRPGDGRECMALTVSSYYPAIPPSNLHARTLPYGMLNWVTRGIFLGERHIYYVPQPDDMLSTGDKWNLATHQVDFNAFRLEPSDLDAVVTWLHAMQVLAPTADLKIEMPFNGDGSEQDRLDGGTGAVRPDTLTAKAVELEDEFVWLNHTYTHADLDHASYATCHYEIDTNNTTASFLGFADYTVSTLLTGAYSGLNNADLVSAGSNLGVQYLLANASDSAYKNPSPNTGIPHPLNNAILQIPRLANNVLYAATTPEELTDMYNSWYGTTYTYEQIMDLITYQSLQELLDFNIDPTMFHMNALNAYAGTQTLLGDFTEALFDKFNALYIDAIPVLSLRTQEIGAKMWERMAYDDSGVSGQLACGNLMTLTTTSAARIPVTGIAYGGDTKTYAGQVISYFDMGANGEQIIPGEPAKKPAAIAGLTGQISGEDVVLNWDATTQDTSGGGLTALVYRVYYGSDPNFTPGPTNLLAQVSSPTYTHTGASSHDYYYAVTAIGDNCWKLESQPVKFNPTAVVLVYFTGVPTGAGVRLTWETAAELNTLGFNLYRAEALGAPRVRVNGALIPSQVPGGVFGATYTFVDVAVTPGATYFYWLEEVDTQGVITLYGPVSVLVLDPAVIRLHDFRAESARLQSMAWGNLWLVLSCLAFVAWTRLRWRQTARK